MKSSTSLVTRRKNSSSSRRVSTPTTPIRGQGEMLELATIDQNIESHPPLMQEAAKKKYLGREVEWPLTFFSGSLRPDGRAHVMFHHASRRFGGVTGDVVLSNYPWLKALRAD